MLHVHELTEQTCSWLLGNRITSCGLFSDTRLYLHLCFQLTPDPEQEPNKPSLSPWKPVKMSSRADETCTRPQRWSPFPSSNRFSFTADSRAL